MQLLLSSMRLLCLLLLVVLQACMHPIEVVGDGKVLSSSGRRDCDAEQSPCVQTITGNYRETYTAVPGPGAVFSHWEACPNIWGNSCSFEVDAALTRLNWFKTAPATQAVFIPDTLAQSPHTVDVEFPPAAATYLEPTIAVRGSIKGPDPQNLTVKVNGGTGWVEAEVAADGNWIARDVALADRLLAPVNIEISEPGYAPRYVLASLLWRFSDVRNLPSFALDKNNNRLYGLSSRGLLTIDLDSSFPQVTDVPCKVELYTALDFFPRFVPATNSLVVSGAVSSEHNPRALNLNDLSCYEIAIVNPELLAGTGQWTIKAVANGDTMYLLSPGNLTAGELPKVLSLDVKTGQLQDETWLPDQVDGRPFAIADIIFDAKNEYAYCLGIKIKQLFSGGGYIITKTTLALTRTRLADGAITVMYQDTDQAPSGMPKLLDFWGSQLLAVGYDQLLSFDLTLPPNQPWPQENPLAALGYTPYLRNALLHPVFGQLFLQGREGLSYLALANPTAVQPYFTEQGGLITYRVQQTPSGGLNAVLINAMNGTPTPYYSYSDVVSASAPLFGEGYHWRRSASPWPARSSPYDGPIPIRWYDQGENLEYIWRRDWKVFERVTLDSQSQTKIQTIRYDHIPSELALAPDDSALFLVYQEYDYDTQLVHTFVEQRDIVSNALIRSLDFGTTSWYDEARSKPLGFVFDQSNNHVYLKYQRWQNPDSPRALPYELARWDLSSNQLLTKKVITSLGLRVLPPNVWSGGGDLRYFSRETYAESKYLEWGIDESEALKLVEIDLNTGVSKEIFADVLQPYLQLSFVDGHYDSTKEQLLLIASNKETGEFDGATFVFDLATEQLALIPSVLKWD